MAYDHEQIWNRAQKVEGYDPCEYRKDVCGAWMRHDDYGNRDSDLGWEVDHVYPVSLLEEADERLRDNPENLRAMNWHNNESKSDDYPVYHAVCRAAEPRSPQEEPRNVEVDKILSVGRKRQQTLAELYADYME